MNHCVLSGKLLRNAVVHGADNRALKFQLSTPCKLGPERNREGFCIVPCVLFQPSEDVERLFTSEGKNLQVDLTGHISRFSFEVEGRQRYATEVVVDPRSLMIRR